MAKPTLTGYLLTMAPCQPPGAWRPSSADDRALLRRVQRPRKGDPVNHPDEDKVAILVAMCASRGVAVTFDPGSPLVEAPSPAPRSGQGGRRK